MQLAGSSERKYTFLSGTNKSQVVHNVHGASDPGQLKIKKLAVSNTRHTLLFITLQSSGTILLKLLFFWTTFIDYKRKILKENMTLPLCANKFGFPTPKICNILVIWRISIECKHLFIYFANVP